MEVTVPVSGGGPGFIAGIFGFFGSLINFLFTLAFFIAAGFLLNLIISKLFFRKLISDHLNKDNKVFLLVKVARSSEQKEPAFDEFLRAVHRILPSGTVFSLELASTNQFLSFYIVVPSAYKNVIESQLYAQYPNAEVEAVKDYLPPLETAAFAEIDFKHFSINPIITYHSLKEDILKSFSSLLSKTQPGEQVFFQIVLKRVGSHFWQRGFQALLVKHETPATIKMSQDLYMGKARVIFVAKDKSLAQINLNTVINIFKIAKSPNNELKRKRFKIFPAPILSFKARVFDSGDLWSSSEIATLFHFPYQGSIVSNVVESTTKRAPAPDILPFQGLVNPKDVSFFGETNYRNEKRIFGIKRIDRRRHLYVVGKSGSGKSKLLELLVHEDLNRGRGVAVLDPHGDLVDNVLRFVPTNRVNDVVLFDPGDIQNPIAFNPLEKVEEAYKMQLTIGFLDIFKKLFGDNWTYRLEHVLRYTTLALLDSPNTTVLSILKMLNDKNYRQKIVARIQDNVVKSFWVSEFAAWSEKFDSEAITPLLNKVGQFVATNMIRNIIGQPTAQFDIRDVMDNKKILLMKVSKGLLGEENSSLIGSMIITKMYQAAMSRANVEEEHRPDFYFYVDEFQNFATDTFYEILSEARKYHLDLTIAHQYMGQLSARIRQTVFGNVGSMISFRVGAEDAVVLEKEYEPIFKERDIINLGVREFYVKMSVKGEIREAFSGRTVDVPKSKEDHTQEIIARSRAKYCNPKKKVEEMLKRWDEAAAAPPKEDEISSVEEKFEEPII